MKVQNSPEMYIIEEVDLVHVWGKQHSWDTSQMVLVSKNSSGVLDHGMMLNSCNQELGRSRNAYPLLKGVATWYKRVVILVTKLLKAVRVKEREGVLEV